MSISNPTVNPQNSDRVKPVVNTTNFPGLILDINANNITGLPIGVNSPSDKSVQSFTDGVGNIISVSETTNSWLTGVNGDKGVGLYLRTVSGSLSLSASIQLSNKPTVLITTGKIASNTTIIGVGDAPGNNQGIGQSVNNSAYTTRGTADYKESFNFVTSVNVLKPTTPIGGGMVTHIADNSGGDWRECYADYKSGVAEHELVLHTGAGVTGAHASNDWSTRPLDDIYLYSTNSDQVITSYTYAMRLIELDTALTDVEMEQLALFVARNPYDLPEFLVDH